MQADNQPCLAFCVCIVNCFNWKLLEYCKTKLLIKTQTAEDDFISKANISVFFYCK